MKIDFIHPGTSEDEAFYRSLWCICFSLITWFRDSFNHFITTGYGMLFQTIFTFGLETGRQCSSGLGKALQSPAPGSASATSAGHGNCGGAGDGCLVHVSCSSCLRRKIWSVLLLHSLAIRTDGGCCSPSTVSDCDNFTDCSGHHLETGNLERNISLWMLSPAGF